RLAAAICANQAVAVALAELDGNVLEQRLGAELHRDVCGGKHWMKNPLKNFRERPSGCQSAATRQNRAFYHRPGARGRASDPLSPLAADSTRGLQAGADRDAFRRFGGQGLRPRSRLEQCATDTEAAGASLHELAHV